MRWHQLPPVVCPYPLLCRSFALGCPFGAYEQALHILPSCFPQFHDICAQPFVVCSSLLHTQLLQLLLCSCCVRLQILTPQERVRVHICNTFFLSALMGQRCEIEAHSRLTRWLKKEVTPLPRKDFIFIPVHHKHQHWSLAVVVCPWRALNPTQKSGGEKAVRSAAVTVKCKPEANRSVRNFQLSFSPGMHAQQAGVERPVSSALAEKLAPPPVVQHQAVELPTPLKTQGPHTHRGCRAKARLFYVDSMGLRSVFDRSRGRLKRFLRHVRRDSLR